MKKIIRCLSFILLIFLLTSCATTGNFDRSKKTSYSVNGKNYAVLKSATGYKARGIASYYAHDFHGKHTASGERFNMYSMTAAHKTLPLGSYVRVTNLKNKKAVILKINDRGPFAHNRLIDVSYAAAKKLGLIAKGSALVEVAAVTHPISKPKVKSDKVKSKKVT